MRRRRNRKFKLVLLLSFSFFILFLSSSYALLSENLKVIGQATISSVASSGGDFIVDQVGGNEDSGLQDNGDGSYDFVGDDPLSVTNFIKIPGDEVLWRVISIDVSGNLKIIRSSDDNLMGMFNSENSNSHDWPSTLIFQTLQDWYQEHLSSYSSIIVQNPEWLLSEAAKNTPTDVTPLGVYTDSPIGLIRNDEVLNSSSSGMTNDGNVSSWLNGDYLWTMTYYSDKATEAWRVNDKGKFMHSSVDSSNTYIRPVIYLKSNTIISSGNGTEFKPFVVKY